MSENNQQNSDKSTKEEALSSDDDAKGKKIQIFVETFMGTKITISVYEHETVLALKNGLNLHADIPAHRQRLVFRDEELRDSSKLSDYSITDGNVLKLILYMRGGPVTSSKRSLVIDDQLIKTLFNIKTSQDLSKVPIIIVNPSRIPELMRLINESAEINDIAECNNGNNSNRKTSSSIPVSDNKKKVEIIKAEDTAADEEFARREAALLKPLSSYLSKPILYDKACQTTMSGNVSRRLNENRITLSKMNELKGKLKTISVNEVPQETHVTEYAGVGTSEPSTGDSVSVKLGSYPVVFRVAKQPTISPIKPEIAMSQTLRKNLSEICISESVPAAGTSSSVDKELKYYSVKGTCPQDIITVINSLFKMNTCGNSSGVSRGENQIVEYLREKGWNVVTPPEHSTATFLKQSVNTDPAIDTKSPVIFDESINKPSDLKIKPEGLKMNQDDLKIEPDDMKSKPSDMENKPNDVKTKSDNVKIKSDDLKIKFDDLKINGRNKVANENSNDKHLKENRDMDKHLKENRDLDKHLKENRDLDKHLKENRDLDKHLKENRDTDDGISKTEINAYTEGIAGKYPKKIQLVIEKDTSCDNKPIIVFPKSEKPPKYVLLKSKIVDGNLIIDKKYNPSGTVIPLRPWAIPSVMQSDRSNAPKFVMKRDASCQNIGINTFSKFGCLSRYNKPKVVSNKDSSTITDISYPPITPSSSTLPVPSNDRKVELLPNKEIVPVSLPKKMKRKRCAECNKILRISGTYTCRCNLQFCTSHRYSEAHKCIFDYREEGRRIIRKNNPLVVADKLPKI